MRAVEDAWAHWAKGDEKRPVHATCRRKDGSTFPAVIQGNTVRDDAAQVLGRVMIIRDVTAELERQRALTQSQRMEAFGQLTGGVAHDFNNLLTVITGNQELLEMRLEDETDLSLLKRAQEAAEMGARLTGRLLTFARKRQLETALLDLNEQIIGMVELLRRAIGEHLTLSTKLAPHLGLVRADASEIENAVLNLVINARDAMLIGGTIVIETAVSPPETGGKRAPGPHIRLTVSDNGAGMTPEVLQQAFEPFFTTKTTGKGTGLGLSTIYGFVQQSGGQVEIQSETGRGTSVSIYLPQVTGDTEPLSLQLENHEAPAVPSHSTILIVEDNPQVRDITARRLQALGYRIRETESGPDAIAVLKTPAHGIDLVFSDVVMPGGITGYDVAEWVAEHAPAIRVLLTSGYPDGAAESAGRPKVRLLRKPYRLNDLAAALRDVMTG